MGYIYYRVDLVRMKKKIIALPGEKEKRYGILTWPLHKRAHLGELESETRLRAVELQSY